MENQPIELKHVEVECRCGNKFNLSSGIKGKIRQQYRNAVWDFVLQHSRITKKGHRLATFTIINEDNLYSRIMARLNGYVRENFEIPTEEKSKELKHVFYSEKFNKTQKRVIDRIKKKSLFLKIILSIYGY